MAVRIKTKRGNALTPRTGYNPQSASRTEMQSRPPVLSDAADTSRDAQRLISQPPQPFANPHGTVKVPAPVNRGASHPYGLPASNLLPKSAGAQNKSNVMSDAEMFAAVGYSANATKSDNPIISGFPTRGNARKAGSGNFPNAKGRR